MVSQSDSVTTVASGIGFESCPTVLKGLFRDGAQRVSIWLVVVVAVAAAAAAAAVVIISEEHWYLAHVVTSDSSLVD